MTRTRDEILESRRRLKAEYGALFDSIAAILHRHDPIGINLEINPDEYHPEVETILPRLRGCRNADEGLEVVRAEFVGLTLSQPVRESIYKQIALEIWQLWQEHLLRRQKTN